MRPRRQKIIYSFVSHKYHMEFRNFIENAALNECVVAGVRLQDGVVLAKNRDRGYKANVEIIHELINGTEVMYWRDVDTDWCEGMNEYGLGMVSSSLMVNQDEKEGLRVINGKKVPDDKHKKIVTNEGNKIRQALSHTNLKDMVKSVVNGKNKKGKNVGLRGQTLVSDGVNLYALEITKDSKVVKRVSDDDSVTVRTNHGIYDKEAGYNKGRKKESSHSRMNLAKKNLADVQVPSDVLDILKKKYVSDPFLNPYRTKSPWLMHTTGQILLDLKNLRVVVRMDNDEGVFRGIVNNLPIGYNSKIRVVVEH